MVTLIKQLIASGHAYEAAARFIRYPIVPEYARCLVANWTSSDGCSRWPSMRTRRAPLDFVLWKQSSVMSGMGKPVGRDGRAAHRVLGEARHISVRCSISWCGLDLIFHIMRTSWRSLLRARHVGYGKLLMHNGFVEVEGKKMSKSEGNFVTIRELWRLEWIWLACEALKFNMLRTHYRNHR